MFNHQSILLNHILLNEGSRWKKSYPTLSKYKYNGTDNSEAFFVFEKHIRMDPLLGVENDFDYPDYGVVSLMPQVESYVLLHVIIALFEVDCKLINN
jgi:hypothetical protein